jgi:cytochrome P450
VICELLAIPPDRRTTQIDRSDDLAHFFFANPPTMQQLSRASESTCAMTEWFRQLHAERQGGTGDDLVTLLARYIHASDEPISVDEVAAQCALLLAAGQETTRNLLGMSCRTLLQNPDALHALAADPALIPGAVEELLRFESPVQLVAREVTEPVTVGGQTIPAGRVVFLMLGSANRDPAVFPDPDRFDIHRANARQHLAFGSGRHFCIGAELARLEAAVALEVLVPVLLKLQLAGEPEWAPNLALRGIKKLPVAWATSPARGHA